MAVGEQEEEAAMRRQGWWLGFVGIACFGLFLSGCATLDFKHPREAQIEALIAEAKKLGAERCAPKELAEAQKYLAEAHKAYNECACPEDLLDKAEKAAREAIKKAKECPPEVAVVPPPAPPVVTEVEMLKDIYFDFDKSHIRDDAKAALQHNAAWMKKNPGVKVQIEGHCDERGTNAYNMGLGDRRASSAKKYLLTLGVNPKQLSTISFGEEKPQCTEHNETCWAKNRRAHFVVISK